jgi:hypothetical protein
LPRGVEGNPLRHDFPLHFLWNQIGRPPDGQITAGRVMAGRGSVMLTDL